MGKRHDAVILLFITIFLLTGCGSQVGMADIANTDHINSTEHAANMDNADNADNVVNSDNADNVVNADNGDDSENLSQQSQENTGDQSTESSTEGSIDLVQAPLKGRGLFAYQDGITPLEEVQEQLLLEYMTLYYESLANLELRSMRHLFSDEVQAQASESGTELQIEIRKMQPADYSLVSYSYELWCSERNDMEDGSIELLVHDDSIQNFSVVPEVDAVRYGGYHRFTLEIIDGRWYIRSHMYFDSLYMELFRDDIRENLAEAYVEAQPEYLSQFSEELQKRQQSVEQQLAEQQTTDRTAEHAYDRAAATAYAQQYVEERNNEWPDYTGSGGNCQNYASQCLIAGGVPMDTTGNNVWKWYGRDVSNAAGSYGRSSSWAGVESFITYASNNSGTGLVAQVDAPYDTGEAGDLIHMGAGEHWGHTVVIADVIRNEAGEVIDYLVYSNTADLSCFPASLYGYPKMMLTKIYGWNS